MNINFKNYNPRNFRLSALKFSIVERNFFEGGKKISLRKLGMISVLVFMVYFLFVASPFSFPVGGTIEIGEGLSTQEIAKELKESKFIKSELLFEVIIRVFRGNNGVISGDYFFERRKNLFSITYRMAKGVFGVTPVRVTIQEGLTVNEISVILVEKFPKFDVETFKKEGEKFEGYLFPDTYYFLPNVKPSSVIKAMKNNFDERVLGVKNQIDASGYSLHEIITMASILEEEGITFQDRKMMSGVLWNRINIGMPLQVDAVFPYIIGKNTYEIDLEDLKNESLYNTYMYKGLPPGPITNPGFNSIVAALEPIEHNYLYYLSDKQYNTYYAEDFEEHKQNRILYLDK
ncbi:endolytic transglycosylase MltG [Patescibacteria group bacterium]|nr:endolytic transglycosylase MltG [Patescibacteria group bacterium]